MNSTCLFIGSSLTDPNLLRYLHAHAGPGVPRHYALFTRQDAYARETAREVIEARESALAARWQSTNVAIVFVDYYAEIAQVLGEIALAKRAGTGYAPLPERLTTWRRAVGDVLFPEDPVRFAEAQDLLQGALREALEAAVATVGDLGYDTGGEVLAATLWVVDETGSTLTGWASTDRAHRDPATIDPVPVTEHSRWLAVRAFCRGAALGEPRDIYASRWKYIRALPLVSEARIPIGTLTITSMRPAGETMLDSMPDSVEAAFDDALRQSALDILEFAFSDG